MSAINAHLEFARMKDHWWWFASECQAHVDNTVAWAWEKLRRTTAYQNFHEAAGRLPSLQIPALLQGPPKDPMDKLRIRSRLFYSGRPENPYPKRQLRELLGQ